MKGGFVCYKLRNLAFEGVFVCVVVVCGGGQGNPVVLSALSSYLTTEPLFLIPLCFGFHVAGWAKQILTTLAVTGDLGNMGGGGLKPSVFLHEQGRSLQSLRLVES